jgi:hypothetical protein
MNGEVNIMFHELNPVTLKHWSHSRLLLLGLGRVEDRDKFMFQSLVVVFFVTLSSHTRPKNLKYFLDWGEFWYYSAII